MIKKLQLKIFSLIIFILAIVMIFLSMTIFFSSSINESNEAKSYLSSLSVKYSRPNIEDSITNGDKDHFMDVRSFRIVVNTNNEIVSTICTNDRFTQAKMTEIATNIIDSGNLKNDYFSHEGQLYFIVKTLPEEERGFSIVGIDRTIEHNVINTTNMITISSFAIGYVALSILVWFLSKSLVKPVKESLEKEKQFISNASHELKTPLAIINANVDVLENDSGENQWLQNIKYQSKHMNKLICNMITLSKSQEKIKAVRKEFNISDTINNCVLPFEAVAFENKKSFEINISTDIMYYGEEDLVKNVATILVDNAIKYSSSKITLNFKIENNAPTLCVYNDGCEVKDSERNRVFERFYRPDSSRNQATGESGLGLSIVESISTNEGWTVSIDSKYHEFMEIKIRFNNKRK